MRLFIAIELDEDARVAIAAEQRRLKAALGHDRSVLKWIRPEHMHLTLSFLGELDDHRSRSVADAMGQPISGNPFPVVFGGLGVFPPGGAPRVLWLGLTSGARGVVDVQRQVADRVARLGIALERRPFHPHVTLARWPAPRQSDRRTAMAADRRHDVARIDVAAVALIHSHLSRAGPLYTTLCRGWLGDWAAPALQS